MARKRVKKAKKSARRAKKSLKKKKKKTEQKIEAARERKQRAERAVTSRVESARERKRRVEAKAEATRQKARAAETAVKESKPARAGRFVADLLESDDEATESQEGIFDAIGDIEQDVFGDQSAGDLDFSNIDDELNMDDGDFDIDLDGID